MLAPAPSPEASSGAPSSTTAPARASAWPTPPSVPTSREGAMTMTPAVMPPDGDATTELPIGDDVLQVSDIDFAYGRLQVLFGVSLSVRRGEALALLGTNGAGKSTLLRVVSGLERPAAGRVILDGDDVTGVPAERLAARGVVLVSGGRAVFGDMSVADNLDVQALTVRKRKAWARERREVVLTTFPKLRERYN